MYQTRNLAIILIIYFCATTGKSNWEYKLPFSCTCDRLCTINFEVFLIRDHS